MNIVLIIRAEYQPVDITDFRAELEFSPTSRQPQVFIDDSTEKVIADIMIMVVIKINSRS